MVAERKDHKNIVIVILIVLLIGVVCYYELIKKDSKCKCEERTVEEKEKESNPTPTPTKEAEEAEEEAPTPTPTKIPENDEVAFVYSNRNYGLASYGEVTVKAYAEVKYKQKDCGVLGSCTEKEAVSVNDIVYLHITNTDNEEFKKTMKELGYEKKAIPIGCLKENVITYRTAADEYGPEKYEGKEEDAYKYYATTNKIDKDLTKKITASTSKKPITLKITKLKLTHYVSLSEQCDSPINGITIVE